MFYEKFVPYYNIHNNVPKSHGVHGVQKYQPPQLESEGIWVYTCTSHLATARVSGCTHVPANNSNYIICQFAHYCTFSHNLAQLGTKLNNNRGLQFTHIKFQSLRFSKLFLFIIYSVFHRK